MNSIAGPSRRRASLHIDLDSIVVDQPRYASPLSTCSAAPSWRPERASTQSGVSAETWGGLQTPLSERSRFSYPGSHDGLGVVVCEDKNDTMSYGRLEVEGANEQTPGPGLGLNVGPDKAGGWWIDLDKTPRPSDTIVKAPVFPSRHSSVSPRPSLALSIPNKPLVVPDHHEECALPDDSPTIPACILLPPISPIELDVPTFRSRIRPRIPVRPPRPDTVLTQDFLALFPVPDLPSIAVETQSLLNPTGPPPLIPTRGSSRSKSRQALPAALVPSASLAPSTILMQGPPPAPPPRASSLRSSSSRPSSTSSTSSDPPPAPSPKHTILSDLKSSIGPGVSPGSLSRQPRVRARTSPAPITRTRTRTPSEQLPTFSSRASLASILEDEVPNDPNDLELEPNAIWSLRERRMQADLQRARSQPQARRGNDSLKLMRPTSATPGGMI